MLYYSMGKRFLNRFEILILFIIWPLLGLLAACGQFQYKKTRFICVLFGALFGYTFVVAGESLDANRYISEFYNYCYEVNDWETWLEITVLKKGTQFFIPLIYSAVSLFTNDYHVLFAVLGFIFSYFMIKSVGILYDCNKNNSVLLKLLLIIFLLSLNFVFNINGARMWVAMWVFCYSLLAYWNGLISKSCSYLLLIFTIFVHWSFLFAFLFFIFYKIVNTKKEVFLYVLLIVSFAVRPLLVGVLLNFQILSGFYEYKIMSYTSSEANEIMESSRQNASFLYGIYNMFFVPAVLILLMYVRKSIKLESNVMMKNMYYFAMAAFSFFNMGANVFQISRFMILFESVAVFFIYSALSTMRNERKRLVVIFLLPLLAFSIANAILLGRRVTSSSLFLPMPFYLIQSNAGVI